MTKLVYEYCNREWTLTDEAASCSYGEPVLIADDGTQMRAGEIACIYPALFDAPGFGPMPVTAATIIENQAHRQTTLATSDEFEEGMEMVRRFLRQASA